MTRRNWFGKAAAVVAVGAVLAVGASAAGAAAMPFYAVQREYVKVPRGVMPWDPSWSPDGRHILFEDDNHGGEWLTDADGTHMHCLTCEWTDNPSIIGGFS